MRHLLPSPPPQIWLASSQSLVQATNGRCMWSRLDDLWIGARLLGSIYDNKELLRVNPEYLGSLLALDEQARLLSGNWKIRQDGSALFSYVNITNLFSNFTEQSEEKYITCDYAREGRDLIVICT